MKYLLLIAFLSFNIFAVEDIPECLYYSTCKVISINKITGKCTGTGFLIDYPSVKGALVVTCAHVAKSLDAELFIEIRIKEQDEKFERLSHIGIFEYTEKVEIIYFDEVYDIAILKLKTEDIYKDKLKLEEHPENLKIGKALWSFGAGLEEIKGGILGFLTSKKSMNPEIDKLWITSHNTYRGYSGGAVINPSNNKVVGMNQGAVLDGNTLLPNNSMFVPSSLIIKALKTLEK